jgi:Cu/Ag efflux protein CusF
VSLKLNAQQRSGAGALALALACLIVSGACGPSRSAKQTNPKETNANFAGNAQPASAKRYPLTGCVVSVDKASQSINVDGDEIPGFMAAMTMPYQVKDASILDKVAPGDQIKADIVVGDQGAYLENVIVAPKTAPQVPTK